MKELVKKVRNTLGIDRHEAELIIATLLNRPYFSLYNTDTVPDRTQSLITLKVDQLHQGVPIEYITKRARFRDYTLHVEPGVFIPRLETEYFVDLLKTKITHTPETILDIGTGTGAISIALAHAFPKSRIIATDTSERALACTRQNIKRYDCADRIFPVQTDMLAGLATRYDLIISNPPYVPSFRLHSLPKSVKYYEPLVALNGGKNGTMFTKIMIDRCMPYVRDNGCMAIEIDEDAVHDLNEFLETFGGFQYQFKKDLFKKYRYLFLEKISEKNPY